MKNDDKKTTYLSILVLISSLLFSFWLMFHTFSYEKNSMAISTKAWSDFAGHIPLIRSFSLGNNFPPEYPLFPGEPIRYHFLFYAFVGLLEKLGVRIDFALNFPSALGFAGLLFFIYFFAKNIFQEAWVGILSVIFFLFNGSLSFLEFFKDHPLSPQIIHNIISNTVFPSFAPYGKGIVSAFWNLNIYTNQRHLAAGYLLSLLLIYFILTTKKPTIQRGLIIGIIISVLFFFNMAVFAMTIIVFCMIFLLFSKYRLMIFVSLLVAAMLSLPQYLMVRSHTPLSYSFLHPGYLISNSLTVTNFITYWFYNLGLHFIIIPLGFLLSNRTNKKILISFFALFIVGNLFQFSNEISANHKFFNYFMIIGVMFSAFAIVTISKRFKVLIPLTVICSISLILSGIIDFFPIKNDSMIKLSDYPQNADIRWIMNNTPPSSIFLNTTYLYDPASLAGRKIFLGWPYFAWSQGYDTYKRGELRQNLYKQTDLNFFCEQANKYNIQYVETQKIAEDIEINHDFFENNFQKMYQSNETELTIYSIKPTC